MLGTFLDSWYSEKPVVLEPTEPIGDDRYVSR